MLNVQLTACLDAHFAEETPDGSVLLLVPHLVGVVLLGLLGWPLYHLAPGVTTPATHIQHQTCQLVTSHEVILRL